MLRLPYNIILTALASYLKSNWRWHTAAHNQGMKNDSRFFHFFGNCLLQNVTYWKWKIAKKTSSTLEHWNILGLLRWQKGTTSLLRKKQTYDDKASQLFAFYIFELREKANVSLCVLSTRLKHSFFRMKSIYFKNNSHQTQKKSPLDNRPAGHNLAEDWIDCWDFFLPNGKHTVLSHPWQKLCIVSKNVKTFTKYFAYKDIFTQKHHCTWYSTIHSRNNTVCNRECRWQTSFWTWILMVPSLKEHFLHIFLSSVWAWRLYSHNHTK